MNNITLSALPKTWIIDVDGTIVEHNGYLKGEDKLLDGVIDFFSKITPKDKVILTTSRQKKYEADLKKFLKKFNLRYDEIIFDLPFGERILINDKKLSGLKTAYAINKDRDAPLLVNFSIDENL